MTVPSHDVIACGELLVDFVAMETGVRLVEARAFEKAAGGAPANVAVGLARLGRSVGFLGQVGADEFGEFLAETLAREGVDLAGLRRTPEACTALAFVSLRAGGERDFMFYRHPSPDMLWDASESDLALATSGRIFHFGSITLIGEPSRGSTIRALTTARRHGSVISYDPNVRLQLWPSERAAHEVILGGLQYASVAKLSREELAFLTGIQDVTSGARRVWHDGLRLLTVTGGAEGCWWFTGDEAGRIPGFQVDPVDTTGAGDAFVAGMLAGLVESEFRTDAATVERILRLANACGALSVTRRGAIPSLATRAEIEQFLSHHGGR